VTPRWIDVNVGGASRASTSRLPLLGEKLTPRWLPSNRTGDIRAAAPAHDGARGAEAHAGYPASTPMCDKHARPTSPPGRAAATHPAGAAEGWPGNARALHRARPRAARPAASADAARTRAGGRRAGLTTRPAAARRRR